jgi:hypothetical protein
MRAKRCIQPQRHANRLAERIRIEVTSGSPSKSLPLGPVRHLHGLLKEEI